ncbi:rCG45972, partial [Rattus norvegicus]
MLPAMMIMHWTSELNSGCSRLPSEHVLNQQCALFTDTCSMCTH